MWQAMGHVSIHPRAFYCQQTRFQPVAQLCDPGRFRLHPESTKLTSLTQSDDGWYIQRSAAHPPLVTAAIHLRRQPHPGITSPDIDGTDALWSIDLMRAECEQIDPIGVYIDRHLPYGLGGIGEEENAMPPGDLADGLYRLDHPDLVVRNHHGDEHRRSTDRSCHFGERVQSLRAH